MKIYYTIKKYNSDMKLIKKTRKMRSRSFLKPFLFGWFQLFGGGSTTTYSDINGVARTFMTSRTSVSSHTIFGNDSTGFTYYADYDSDSCGIQVGRGNTAVAMTDYKLETVIPHGTSSNQFMHKGTYCRNFVVNDTTDIVTFDVEAIFINSSGSSVDVKEAGMYYEALYAGASSYASFCTVRDVLTSTISVANGEYLQITYTISVAA